MRLPVLPSTPARVRAAFSRPWRSLGVCLLLTATLLPAARAQQTVVVNYGNGSLSVVDLNTGARTILASASLGTGPEFQSPLGIVQAGDGSLLVANRGGKSLLRVDPATGNRTELSGPNVGAGPAFNDPWAVAVESDGNILVGDQGSGHNLYRVDPVTGDRVILTANFASITGLWIEPDGNIVVVNIGKGGGGSLLRVNKTTGAWTTITGEGSFLKRPTGLARRANGHFLVTNETNPNLVDVDPVNGAQTLVSGTDRGAGPTIGMSYGVSITAGGEIFVLSFQSNAVIRVDPTTGDRTIVSGPGVGTGDSFEFPLSILGAAVANITQPPTSITSVTAPTAGLYGAGQQLNFTVTFDDTVTVTGTPRLVLTVGSETRYASYVAGSGSASLTFRYTIASGENDADGISVGTSLQLNGGSIFNSGAKAVSLSLPSVGGSVRIDAVKPTFTSPSAATGTLGVIFSHPVLATDANPVTYSATGLPTGVTIDANTGLITGSPLAAGSFTAAIKATDVAGNAQTQSLTLTILPGVGAVQLSQLAQTYNGSPRAVTVTTLPAGLNTVVTYNGSTTTPINAGTYTVLATLSDPNYTGSTSGTLTIHRATQTVSFGTPATPTIGQPVQLSATASSGLPVTFSVASGPGTLSGNLLTITGTSPVVVVKASQAGDTNYLPASATYSFNQVGKLSQSIRFDPLTDRPATDGPATLSATATSGLPVSFSIVSGPALLEGERLTLTGAPGRVVVRASQSGNDMYQPAPDATQSFTVNPVGPQVYFGQMGSGAQARKFAAELGGPGRPGTLLGTLPNGDGYLVSFLPGADGAWSATATLFPTPLAVQTAQVSVAPRSAAPKATHLTFRGNAQGGVLSGSIDELGLAFFATLEPPKGPTADLAGYYPASSLNSAAGETYAVVGTQGHMYLLLVGQSFLSGESGSVDRQGGFRFDAPNVGTVIGRVDAQATSVTGTLILGDGTTANFSGVRDSTARTDRLINLSTRARVVAGDGFGTLITGFVIGGTESKSVLLRGVGPTLSGFGLSQTLADPRLRVFDAAGRIIAENDNWGGAEELSATMARVGAFALPADSRDAALLLDLAPGVYSVHVLNGGSAGLALAEIYDASTNPAADYQRLINISSRGQVTSGDGVLIGGFSVTGNAPKRVLIRGAGPALATYGVANPLRDPQLALFNSAGERIATNNDWETPVTVDSAQVSASADEITRVNTRTGAFAFDKGSKDAAIVVTLAPGSYTAHLSSATSESGVALIEIYEVVE